MVATHQILLNKWGQKIKARFTFLLRPSEGDLCETLKPPGLFRHKEVQEIIFILYELEAVTNLSR